MATKLSFCWRTGSPICESGILRVKLRETITGTGAALLTFALADGGTAGAFTGRGFASGVAGADGPRRALTAGISGAVPCCNAASLVPAGPVFGPRSGRVAASGAASPGRLAGFFGVGVSTNFTVCAGTTSSATGGSTATATVA